MCIFNDPYTCSPIDDSTTDIPICAAECCGQKEAPHHSQGFVRNKAKVWGEKWISIFSTSVVQGLSLAHIMHYNQEGILLLRLYYEQKELCLSKNIEPAFIRDGFSNWKGLMHIKEVLVIRNPFSNLAGG